MIFVDSSFWIAQQIPRDRLHVQARELEDSYDRASLVTTGSVVGETWTFIRRRVSHQVAMTWFDELAAAARIDVVCLDPALEDEAWAWLRRHDERPYSFVDATSFAVMRKLRITDALAFDGDFAAAGFNELRA